MHPLTRLKAIHLAGLLTCVLFASSKDKSTLSAVATIDIEQTSLEALDKIKNDRHISWWAEFGDTLVGGGTGKSLALAGIPFTSYLPPPDK